MFGLNLLLVDPDNIQIHLSNSSAPIFKPISIYKLVDVKAILLCVAFEELCLCNYIVLSLLIFLLVNEISTVPCLVARFGNVSRNTDKVLVTLGASVGVLWTARVSWGSYLSRISLIISSWSRLISLKLSLIRLIGTVSAILTQRRWRGLPLTRHLRCYTRLIHPSRSCSTTDTGPSSSRSSIANTSDNLIINIHVWVI